MTSVSHFPERQLSQEEVLMRPIVVFGASGHEGRRLAAALLRRGVRTVLAGRDEAKLRAVREALGDELEIRVADAHDRAALGAMLEGAGAVLNTVRHLGEAVVEAAIAARVHYVDTSTDQAFPIRLRERFHAAARRAGVVVLTGQGCDFAFGYLGAAMLEARFGPLHRLESYYDLGEPEPGRASAKRLIASLGEAAIRFEAGRIAPLSSAPRPRRTKVPTYDAAPFTVPLAGGEAALLPHEMPSLRAVASHLVLRRAAVHGAAMGFASRPRLRPWLEPPLRGLLARAIDHGRALGAGAAEEAARPFKIVVTGTSRAAHHTCLLRGRGVDATSAEVAALAGALLAEGRAKDAGVLTTGAALDPQAFLAELEGAAVRFTIETRPREVEPIGRREVQTTAIAKAPADEVWERLLETNAWSRWNESLAGLRGDIREGEKVKLVVSANGRRMEIPVRVEAVEAGRELRWSGGIAGLMRGTHYFRLEPAPGGHTRITHGERFAGAVAALSWPFVSETLRKTYQRVTDQLAGQFDTRRGVA
jgi:short subunit dehydrogenase-like uncharacterized protein